MSVEHWDPQELRELQVRREEQRQELQEQQQQLGEGQQPRPAPLRVSLRAVAVPRNERIGQSSQAARQ